MLRWRKTWTLIPAIRDFGQRFTESRLEAVLPMRSIDQLKAMSFQQETANLTTSPGNIALPAIWATMEVAELVKPKPTSEVLAKEHPAEMSA